jgi:hypothetical protein
MSLVSVESLYIDIVEEIHVTWKAGLTKPRWRELLRRFKEGEQIYISQQVQIEQEDDDQDEEEEELDLTGENPDYVELQNYLSIVGKWKPENLVENKLNQLKPIFKNEEILIPDYKDFINSNPILGKAIKDITKKNFESEIESITTEHCTKLESWKSIIPCYLPLKLLFFTPSSEFSPSIIQKLSLEFQLKLFDAKAISQEMEKLVNPPAEEEVPDPKKAKGKAVQEEPPENEEEFKKLKIIAEKIRGFREDNPGVETIYEDHLMEILAVKIKYSFASQQDDLVEKVKQGIRNDVFRPPEEEVDPKKAKGKGPSKEELEEELTKYKIVQPSGFMITNLPKTKETLIFYEKCFNGYTPPEEVPQSEYEKSLDTTSKLFPCSLGEQEEYTLEQHNNFLLQRSLNLTSEIIEKELDEESVLLVEKNTPKDLEQKFVVIDEGYEEFKNLHEDYGKETIQIPHKWIVSTKVDRVIPAVEEGQEERQKTPEEVEGEILDRFRKQFKVILEKEQKVLDRIIEENIDVVRQEIEDEKVQEEQEQTEQVKGKEVPKEKNKEETKEELSQEKKKIEEIGEGEHRNQPEGENGEGDQEEIEEPKLGFHPEIVSELYNNWKLLEREYAKNMMKLFKLTRKQHENIQAGLDEMKSNFKSFLQKSDSKQEKLDQFIESFNKFTEEFPELRPDDQTKEELNNRWDILNEEFWEIIEANKNSAIEERKSLMNSGWTDREMIQLTIKAQQLFKIEINRCIKSLAFLHSHHCASTSSSFPCPFPSSPSLNESSIISTSNCNTNNIIPFDLKIQNDTTKTNSLPEQSATNLITSSFPLLTSYFTKALSFCSSINTSIQDLTDLQLKESAHREWQLLIYRLMAVYTWTVNGLKDIRGRIGEAYDVLDEWVVASVKAENEAVNEWIQKIRQVIASNEPLELDLKVGSQELVTEGEDDVKFIETTVDKSFITGKSKSKFSLHQAKEYFDIFKRFARDQYILTDKVKKILITNVKLNPGLIPKKWKEYPLSHIENIVMNLEKEDQNVIDWRHFLTFWILSESFVPMVDRNAVTLAYKKSLKSKLRSEFEEYINLEKFLLVTCWYDNYLSMKRKEDVEYEEDKEEIDREVEETKSLLFQINISMNGLLHIDTYISTILSLWPKV